MSAGREEPLLRPEATVAGADGSTLWTGNIEAEPRREPGPLPVDPQWHGTDFRSDTGVLTVQWDRLKPELIRDEPRRVALTPEEEAKVRETLQRLRRIQDRDGREAPH